MKRKKYKRTLFPFVILGIGFVLFSLLSFTDHRIFPSLKERSHIQCRTMANRIIDSAAEEIISDMDLAKSPLYLTQENGYAANTALINHFCREFSVSITEQLDTLPKEKLHIPLGSVTKIQFLSSRGPKIPFTLLPMGSAKVDYSSNFQSVGINQINYKIWLDVTIDLKIVNPFYEETVTMTRKIILADIIFSGKVPEQYIQMPYHDEYLLTE